MSESKEYLSTNLEHGTVHINEDVITTIALTAIKDVEGVVGMSGNLGEDLAGMLGMKNSGKGLRVELGEDYVDVDCSLTVLYGHSVVEIAKNVQNGVSGAIESMTGMKVRCVNVNVSSIAMSK